MDGERTLFNEDGRFYIGQFRDNKRHDRRIIHVKDGNIITKGKLRMINMKVFDSYQY